MRKPIVYSVTIDDARKAAQRILGDRARSALLMTRRTADKARGHVVSEIHVDGFELLDELPHLLHILGPGMASTPAAEQKIVVHR